jgi:hypothetical protein
MCNLPALEPTSYVLDRPRVCFSRSPYVQAFIDGTPALGMASCESALAGAANIRDHGIEES